MKKLLFLDACISSHDSRTKKLCNEYIKRFLEKNPDYELETVVLRKGTVDPYTDEYIIERDGYIAQKDWDHPMFDLAKQYKEADHIIVGTPYWNLSFASIVNTYIENIIVGDLTFGTTDTGFVGLCKGDMITYITAAGGYIGNKNFGYEYIKGIAEMTGVKDTEFFSAEGFDIVGNDEDALLEEGLNKIRAHFA